LLPTLTYSAHWIRHPQLAAAIGEFVLAEAVTVKERAAIYAAHSPFRAEGAKAGLGSVSGGFARDG
jgi:predicted N-acyltransferase